MTAISRIQPASDPTAVPALSDRMREFATTRTIAVYPADGDRSSELAAAAAAAMGWASVIATDEVDATTDVVTVIEALLEAARKH